MVTSVKEGHKAGASVAVSRSCLRLAVVMSHGFPLLGLLPLLPLHKHKATTTFHWSWRRSLHVPCSFASHQPPPLLCPIPVNRRLLLQALWRLLLKDSSTLLREQRGGPRRSPLLDRSKGGRLTLDDGGARSTLTRLPSWEESGLEPPTLLQRRADGFRARGARCARSEEIREDLGTGPRDSTVSSVLSESKPHSPTVSDAAALLSRGGELFKGLGELVGLNAEQMRERSSDKERYFRGTQTARATDSRRHQTRDRQEEQKSDGPPPFLEGRVDELFEREARARASSEVNSETTFICRRSS